MYVLFERSMSHYRHRFRRIGHRQRLALYYSNSDGKQVPTYVLRTHSGRIAPRIDFRIPNILVRMLIGACFGQSTVYLYPAIYPTRLYGVHPTYRQPANRRSNSTSIHTSGTMYSSPLSQPAKAWGTNHIRPVQSRGEFLSFAVNLSPSPQK